MTPQPTTICTNCGKPVYRAPKRLESGEIITCSVACKAILMQRPHESNAICAQCGKPFYRNLAALAKSPNPCCSKKCGYAYRNRPNRICETCGKAFHTRDPQIRFCSKTCAVSERKLRETGVCAICGIPVTRTQAQKRKSRWGYMFCSREHAISWQMARDEANGLEVDFLLAFPQLKFVGNGGLWIRDAQGWMCPDFILPGTHKLIETWGDFWHRDDVPQARINRLASIGFTCLVIWESEFRNHFDLVQKRVDDFLQDVPSIVSEPSGRS